ncbi:NADP-dependent aldehyde dehydrogenase [Altererythrobacter atlanticus]|uniref:2,5-dioxovalerate dehydrogenase n=1 Tax=Croceibacterium atlanticum TaxID=1267766 RepID=A0A0F7KVP1_9SPHN|nr:aldehyde dehydrogenase (NADP(+)) [Croceibacterium atlanticum]AKH43221.1 NADP-dependent fatty aldehyde dehydrogenase [Croceibacterium atlanticum]MBB5732074.1 NADP-dependent aldehyde dehydrogenase [Croceibacterium atlanticum]
MTITGENFVAGVRRPSNEKFRARDASSGEEFGEEFAAASKDDVADACSAAAEAQWEFAALPAAARARFLRKVADRIDALGETLTRRAMQETGLPEARLTGERGRTVGQLRLFADEVEEGGWLDLRIDHADAGRTPPKPDLRLRKIPLGPVAVFGASNFPLAFSVAGGDTASALAAGCCVVVKAHPAHPGTSELVAGAIAQAVAEEGLPAGVFSMLHGPSNALGEALVTDPRISAVGFTGSRSGGLALMRHAASRPVPIPVYAEMSSVNPVIILPHIMAQSAEDLGRAYVGSLTMGVGQFCTNPGIVLTLGGEPFDRFIYNVAQAIAEVPANTMLTGGISDAYRAGSQRLGGFDGVSLVGMGGDGTSLCGQAQVYTCDGTSFAAQPDLADEVFGPASLVVRCDSMEQMREILGNMEGQLTTSLHMIPQDYEAAGRLMPVLEKLAGRIIANGWPTGVDVTHAMVHGGPFPATSDGRSTSVGTMAIDRFLRPVSYQDMPDELLPEMLRGHGANIPVRIDGKRQFG